jgi:hypothetical protein
MATRLRTCALTPGGHRIDRRGGQSRQSLIGRPKRLFVQVCVSTNHSRKAVMYAGMSSRLFAQRLRVRRVCKESLQR